VDAVLGLCLVYASAISHSYIEPNTNDRTSIGNSTGFIRYWPLSIAVISLKAGYVVCAVEL